MYKRIPQYSGVNLCAVANKPSTAEKVSFVESPNYPGSGLSGFILFVSWGVTFTGSQAPFHHCVHLKGSGSMKRKNF